MSTSNSVYPRTRPEDERLIQKEQRNFGSGMILDVDVIDVPENAVADLNNMRATAHGLSGRPGTTPYTDLELPYEFLGLSLTVTETEDEETFLITSTTSIFTSDHIGYKIRTADDQTFFIIDYVSATQVTTSGKSVALSGSQIDDCRMRGPLNANIVDPRNGDSYYLIGTKLYGRLLQDPVWQEYTISADRKPYSATSTFSLILDYIILSNQNGMFIFNKIEDGLYAWLANSDLPSYKVDKRVFSDEEEKGIPAPSAYNYAYGYTRMKDHYNESRYIGKDFIERETPGYLLEGSDQDITAALPEYHPDFKNEEYTNVIFDRPCSPNKYVPLITNSSDHKKASWWKKEGADKDIYLELLWNGVVKKAFINFSRVYETTDVAYAMQVGLGLISSNIRVHLYEYGDNLQFEFSSIAEDDTFTFTRESNSNTDEYNLFQTVLNLDPSQESEVRVTNIVRYFRALGVKDLTHYSVYRSGDMYPYTLTPPDVTDARIGTKPELLGLIDDIPACKLGTGYSTDQVLTVPYGSFTEGDVGNTITYWDGSQWTSTVLEGFISTAQFTLSENTADFIESPIYYGCSDIRDIIKTGDVVSVVTGEDFTDDDIDKFLYWQDGSYSIIRDVDAGTALTVDTTTRNSEYCITTLTYRSYNDVVSDLTLNGYLTRFPMNMRFFDAMPNTNIAAYAQGLFVTAKRDLGELYYSHATEVSRIGYKNSSGQINNTLSDGIKSVVSIGGYFAVSTYTDTYTINPAQSKQYIDNNLGEAYTILPDPRISSSGIGTTHQAKFADGINQGLVLVTNEPAVRFFNGLKYDSDLSEGLIRRTELQTMDSMMIIAYDNNSGVYIWGREL